LRVSARRSQGYAHTLRVRGHEMIADEPEASGGTDRGPSPTELLALSLASCTAVTVEMYAGRKGWEVGEVEVDVDYQFDAPGRGRYEVAVKLAAALSDDQRERLRVIAGKCPVHRILLGDVTITDRVQVV
jgi:putative redox protein